VEAPLKSILRGAGVAADACVRIRDEMEAIEREACSRATLIICVSKSDRYYYRSFCSEPDVTVVPNGVDRPLGQIFRDEEPCRIFTAIVSCSWSAARPRPTSTVRASSW
jgi:hypothetical protein